MSILNATTLTTRGGTVVVPVRELRTRIIQHFRQDYSGGEWNPDNNNNWAPGSFVDFTPRRADSRIAYTWRCPHAWSNASHAISHWRFFVNGILYYWHNTSGVHIEDGCVMKWDVPSWGTTVGRIGYQVRSYANDNHETRLYTTYYWNGTGRSAQNAPGQLIVEEYASTDDAPSVDGTYVAR